MAAVGEMSELVPARADCWTGIEVIDHSDPEEGRK